MGFRHLALLIALFAPFGSAKAQHPLILNRLNGWNQAAPAPSDLVLTAEVRRKASEIYGASSACTNSDITLAKVEPASADRYAFNALVRGAIKNAWFVTARMVGCDPAPVRYMVTQNLDDSLKTIRVNRGVSHTWESLLGDTLPSVQLAANAALQRKGLSCSADDKSSLGVLRIAFEEPDLGSNTFGIRYAGSWTEVWPIEACKQTVEVSIRFTADGDGGAYTHIPGDKTRILP
ncbi:hypothetical protein [Sphingomonas sp. C3-2]|uniref:hypothetical protein n=1 Tax=Sphingomonas sp. C3-2 TaxID=3062169 RepID=UPI00294B9161|nr:hypothetical protein [Sphingomonas sp. C3-2]WOK35774.1 hypothetical protein QYC26_12230 [Sphingomonas sp. C3-2]